MEGEQEGCTGGSAKGVAPMLLAVGVGLLLQRLGEEEGVGVVLAQGPEGRPR